MQSPYKGKKVRGKQMLEHRFVMEHHLGRKLDGRREQVHHINGDKRDNRIENLRVVTPKEHAVEHGRWKYPTTKICAVCHGEFTPHPTKRKRAKTCSQECRLLSMSRAQRRPDAPTSQYRKNAYPSQVAARLEP